MKALLQRVDRASVTVAGELVSEINRGLLILLGVVSGDTEVSALSLAKKCCGLRIFEDAGGKMNLSLPDVAGEMLIVPQFTLAANCKRGRRPSFDDAAPPTEANLLYQKFCNFCRGQEIAVKEGKFATHMKVNLINDGPVTIMLDSHELE